MGRQEIWLHSYMEFLNIQCAVLAIPILVQYNRVMCGQWNLSGIASLYAVWVVLSTKRIAGVKVFKIIPEFRMLRLTQTP